MTRTKDASPASSVQDADAIIPVLRPQLPTADRLLPYLHRIDARRIYSNWGPLVCEFERRIADYLRLSVGSIVSASSGTAALVGAILSTAGRATKERPYALVPAFTFVATAAAAEQCGYRLYLADIDPHNWMLDPERLASHPALDQTGLIIPVAPFGRPVPQAPWRAIREKTGIPVVIDGAASFETVAVAPELFLGGIPLAMSFHATKSFATGEGGCAASSDTALVTRIGSVLNFGFNLSRDSGLASINGKMSEYHAAVGLAELDGWSEKRAALRAVADCYRRLLAAEGLGDRFAGAPDIGSNYALFLCRDAREAGNVRKSLTHSKVDYRLWYGGGLQHHAYLSNLPREGLDVTEHLATRLLGIPVAPDLPEAKIARVVDAIVRGLA